jgi:hypothetical protein
MAALTNIRCTSWSWAAALMMPKWPFVHALGLTSLWSSATTPFLMLDAAQLSRRHRREPDVGVEPDLVARVTGDHRTAAPLRHVADQEAGPEGV